MIREPVIIQLMIPAPTGPAGDNGPPRLLLAELLKDVSPELVMAEILITATAPLSYVKLLRTLFPKPKLSVIPLPKLVVQLVNLIAA